MKNLLNTKKYRKNIREACEKSYVRYSALLEQTKKYKNLNESAGTTRTFMTLIDESIKLEKLFILEAFSKKDPEETVETARQMVDAVQGVAENLGMWQLSEVIADCYNNLMDAYQTASAADKQSMSRYSKALTDIGVITKGLLAFSDEVKAVHGPARTGTGGAVADILRSSLATAGENEGEPLAELLFSVDSELKISGGKKPGMLSKLMNKGQRTGGLERWKAAVSSTLNGTAPGFAKLVDVNEFASSLAQQSIPDIVMTFSYYADKAMSVVDDEFLNSMTRKSVWGGLKDLVGGFFSGKSTPGASKPQYLCKRCVNIDRGDVIEILHHHVI